MATFRLNNPEIDGLFSQDPAEKDKGGFQAFFVKLQENCNRSSGLIELSGTEIRAINKHIREYKKGGWQRKIKRIFERPLGSVFPINTPMKIYLIEVDDEKRALDEEFEGHIIVAADKKKVVSVAKYIASKKGGKAWNSKNVSEIGTYTGSSKDSFVVLSSFYSEL